MITCEHCGSPLPDGAITCGECGRAVTGAARRNVVREQPSAPTPPPLQAPGPHGGRRDPASEAWLPESTLDPATRAWLTGDRAGRQGAAPVPVDRPTEDYRPRTAPTHVHGSGTGLGDWTGRVPSEPPLDPDAFPSSAPSGATDGQRASGTGPGEQSDSGLPVDTEATVFADRIPSAPPIDPAPSASEDTAPAWRPPVPPAPLSTTPTSTTPATSDLPSTTTSAATPSPAAPIRPSWWIDRGPSATTDAGADAAAEQQGSAGAQTTTPSTAGTDGSVVPGSEDASTGAGPADGLRRGHAAHRDDTPRPGDTAIVPPLLTPRQAPRTTPLVAPGQQGATCHVCGHPLEPDDIFCEECGAVIPAVTAAYTGPVMPLPMARPDWSVTDADAGPGEPASSADAATSADGAAEQDTRGTSASDVPSVPPMPGGAAPSARARLAAWAGRRASAGSVSPEAAFPESASPESQSPGSASPEATSASSDSGAAEVESDASAGTSHTSPPLADGSAPASTVSRDEVGATRETASPAQVAPDDVRPALDDVQPARDQDPASDEVEVEVEVEVEDVDATRIVARTPQRAAVVLHFSTGERVGVQGSGLVGRLPRPGAGERFDDLVTIVDPGKSVSKTHLELGRDGDDLWVSDRNSGNGTVVRHIDGSIRRCEPGRRYRVERGARVDIGEQFFLVQ